MQKNTFSKKRFILLLVISLLFLMNGTTALAQNKAEKSLYERIGGYDAIAALTDDVITKMVANPQLKSFFAGHSTDSKMRIRGHFVDQLCAAFGGPCTYKGRKTKTAHKGLGISESDWELTVKIIVKALDKLKVPPKEQNEVLAIVSSLKQDIVETKVTKK